MFDFKTEDRYLDRARESVEISFYTKRKCVCVFSFPKKNFCQFGLTVNTVNLVTFWQEQCRTLATGVQVNECAALWVCSWTGVYLKGCATFKGVQPCLERIPRCLSDGTNLLHWTTRVKNRLVLECGRGASSVLLSRIFFFSVNPS
jgi:hypothetical protein